MLKQELISMLNIINILLFTKWDYNPLYLTKDFHEFPSCDDWIRTIKIIL